MLSTSPMVLGSGAALHNTACSRAGYVMPKEVERRAMEHKLHSAPREDDSTDVGASDASNSTFTSPCCTDSEMQSCEERKERQHWQMNSNCKARKQHDCLKGTLLELKVGKPYGKEEHGTVVFAPAPQLEMCKNENTIQLANFLAPPGLCQKARNKPKESAPILATECADNSKCNGRAMQRNDTFRAPPGLPSPARRRRTKTFAIESMLATVPADADVSCLPSSPNRRTRLAIMDKAKRDGVPVKVEVQHDSVFPAVLLNPALPAKKRLPFFEDVVISLDQNVRKLKPGMPVKKRVNPW
eukprot:CAMPEP_0169156962 /NCGR_PEP_ID=MMETSP1015-20121227/54322_1 /TAXON_ID=342587 /ORGANISM="Karlodinium micrum, Strain CCMP2283" /LENGTH=298 /DNA_ID=CAMNT_0009227849 /DNA_START=83 /DNA_END=976 /DNA_ORIENTATION=-